MNNYTTEQLRQILNAYVRDDENDPSLKRWREENNALPEDGFLPAAYQALGDAAYRRALLPFQDELNVFADEIQNRGDYPQHGIDVLRELIKDFPRWCAHESWNGAYASRLLWVMEEAGFAGGASYYEIDDDRLWACMTAIHNTPLDLDALAHVKTSEFKTPAGTAWISEKQRDCASRVAPIPPESDFWKAEIWKKKQDRCPTPSKVETQRARRVGLFD